MKRTDKDTGWGPPLSTPRWAQMNVFQHIYQLVWRPQGLPGSWHWADKPQQGRVSLDTAWLCVVGRRLGLEGLQTNFSDRSLFLNVLNSIQKFSLVPLASNKDMVSRPSRFCLGWLFRSPLQSKFTQFIWWSKVGAEEEKECVCFLTNVNMFFPNYGHFYKTVINFREQIKFWEISRKKKLLFLVALVGKPSNSLYIFERKLNNLLKECIYK